MQLKYKGCNLIHLMIVAGVGIIPEKQSLIIMDDRNI
jgi:hypothetical protein